MRRDLEEIKVKNFNYVVNQSACANQRCFEEINETETHRIHI